MQAKLLLLCLLALVLPAAWAATPATPPDRTDTSSSLPFVNEWIRPNAVEGLFFPLREGAGTGPAALLLRGIVEETRNTQRAGLSPGRQQLQDELAALEQWVQEWPDSPYAPSVRVALGGLYRKTGRITLALEHLATVWTELQGMPEPVAVQLADQALLGYTQLLLRLGRLETLNELFAQARGRNLGPLAVEFRRCREAWQGMRKRPEIAYKCGPFAVNNVARQVLGRTLPGVFKAFSARHGFTLAELEALSAAHDFPMQAVAREAGDTVPVPSVVHWAQNHFAAVLERRDNLLWVVDPTFDGGRWIDWETFNAEASGYFLVVPGQPLPAGFRPATPAERGVVAGQGYPWMALDVFPSRYCWQRGFGLFCDTRNRGVRDICAPDLTGSGSAGAGLASWNVSEPSLNLTVFDTPLMLFGGRGPEVKLDLLMDQRRDVGGRYQMRYAPGSTMFGHSWMSAWQGCVTPGLTHQIFGEVVRSLRR